MNPNIVDAISSNPLLPLQFARKFHEEVNSPENTWYAGEAVGHSPTWDERLVHFVMSGGKKACHKRFLEEHRIASQ